MLPADHWEYSVAAAQVAVTISNHWSWLSVVGKPVAFGHAELSADATSREKLWALGKVHHNNAHAVVKRNAYVRECLLSTSNGKVSGAVRCRGVSEPQTNVLSCPSLRSTRVACWILGPA